MAEYIKAGKFKAECLQIMERVKRTRRRIIITKRNVPVAQIAPLEEQESQAFGKLKGSVNIKGDIILPIDEDWDANR